MTITPDSPGDDGFVPDKNGSKDNLGKPPGDHDEPYVMGKHHPRTDNPFPFKQLEFVDLLRVKASPEATTRRIRERQRQDKDRER